jgi:hypothetical protein
MKVTILFANYPFHVSVAQHIEIYFTEQTDIVINPSINMVHKLSRQRFGTFYNSYQRFFTINRDVTASRLIINTIRLFYNVIKHELNQP